MTHTTEKLKTYFAPPERAQRDEIQSDVERFLRNALLCRTLNAIPEPVLILNWARQIVYANRSFIEQARSTDLLFLIGQRPGEALDCIHSCVMEAGCGTSIFCRECGGAKATLSAQRGTASVEECRITQQHSHDALDFRVWTSPFEIENGHFTLFVISDISNEKRRQALERIFFHDVLNTAGVLRGYTEILPEMSAAELDKTLGVVLKLSERLIDEIKAQRELIAAENGELHVEKTNVDAHAFIHDIAEMYRNQKISANKSIELSTTTSSISFESDRTLLGRVVGNMLKNALEATPEGGTIRIGCSTINGSISFSVTNPSVIPQSAQLQIFHRSFSTKGKGRGLGTYSMQMLSRRYLNGDVSFTSTKEDGTTFTATYPLVLNN